MSLFACHSNTFAGEAQQSGRNTELQWTASLANYLFQFLGRLRKNVEPLSSVLSNHTRPPMSSIKFLHIERPTPTDFSPFKPVRPATVFLLKTKGCNSSGIPIPSSFTLIITS